MNKKFKRTSAELICGILISGALIQIVDLLVAAAYPQFAGMRLLFASGLWIGVAVAIILEVHMYRSIARALDMRPEDADGFMRRVYLSRTAVILLAAAAVKYFGLGYVMAYFVGVLCLNSGAFLQRVLHLMQERTGKTGGEASGKVPGGDSGAEVSGEKSGEEPSGEGFDGENLGGEFGEKTRGQESDRKISGKSVG